MKALDVRLFKHMGKGFSLPHSHLKVIFSGFPLTCRCRGHTRNRVRKPEDRPKHYRSGINQLTNQGIKLPSLRTLTQDDEALNYEREHPPRTHCVLFAATGQPSDLFMKDRQRSLAITAVGQLPKERPNTHSASGSLCFQLA
jgi:hypothetical protein